MRFERITNPDSAAFESAWQLYLQSFPEHEQRTREEQVKAMADTRCRFDAAYDGERFVGLLIWWHYPAFVYVENLAVEPASRGGGYGSRILEHLKTLVDVPQVLEIDPLTDEVAIRRWRFYEKLGYVRNPYRHIHPSYRPGHAAFEMVLLSYPQVITTELYEVFRREETDWIIPLDAFKSGRF